MGPFVGLNPHHLDGGDRGRGGGGFKSKFLKHLLQSLANVVGGGESLIDMTEWLWWPLEEERGCVRGLG